MASDDGRRFITLSSEDWFAAAVAAGGDEAAARDGRAGHRRLHGRRPAASGSRRKRVPS